MAGGSFGVRDIPIDKNSADLLDLGRYASALAEFISRCETPITVGIQGDWGSGKTSLMNLIMGILDETNKVETIELNTWQYAQVDAGEALPYLLLAALAQKVGATEKDKGGVISKSLREFARLKSFNIGFAGISLGAEREQADKAQREEKVADIADLKNDFGAAIVQRLKVMKKDRFVVFIDDLDRVRPERAVEILEVLKNFVDVPSAVFVIACDYQVVVKGLKVKFGVSESDLGGRSFFDKIIQVPFRIPVHQYDVQRFVTKMLESVDWTFRSADLPRYLQFLELSVGYNPRSVKRLCNTLLLLGLVAKQAGLERLYGDPNRAMLLFGIVCLEASYERLHAELAMKADDADALALMLGLGGEVPLSQRISKETLGKIGDERKIQRAQGLLDLLRELVHAGSDDEISSEEKNTLVELLQLSSVTSVADSPGQAKARAWEEDDLQSAFRASGNSVMLELLRLGREHSHDGMVTGKNKTQSPLVKFFVQRDVEGRAMRRQLISASPEWLAVFPNNMDEVLSAAAISAFREELGRIFEEHVNLANKDLRVRMEHVDLDRVRAFREAVLRLIAEDGASEN